MNRTVCNFWAFPRRLCATLTSDFDQNTGPGLSSVLGAVPVHGILKDSLLQFAAVAKGISTKRALASKHLYVNVTDRPKYTANKPQALREALLYERQWGDFF